jgi:hypothetical protein
MPEQIAPATEDSETHYALRRPMPLLVALLIAAIGCGPQLFVTLFLVPKNTEVYRELFAERPLPAATTIILQLQWAFVAFAFLWALRTMLAIRRSGSVRHMTRNLLVASIPVALTVGGLILPLILAVVAR